MSRGRLGFTVLVMTAVRPLAVPSIPGPPVREVAWPEGETTRMMGLPFFRPAVEPVDRDLDPGQSAVHTSQTDGGEHAEAVRPHGRGPS